MINSNSQLNCAVLFVIFNRPSTTAKVFDAIRKARPESLYIAADGPRPDVFSDVDLIQQSRKVASQVDWPCKVKTLFRTSNLGCRDAVCSAIDWFFEQESEGIILEDDTVPSATFFLFCQILLERYRNDSRVGMISGSLRFKFDSNESYVFSKNKDCWGWATWNRAWRNMDLSMRWRNSSASTSILKNMGVTKWHKRHWERALHAIDLNHVSAWDWPWYFSLAASSQLTIFPTCNLITNIGFGVDSTHFKGNAPRQLLNASELVFPLRHPTYVINDAMFDFQFERSRMHTGFAKAIILNVLPKNIKQLVLRLYKRYKENEPLY